MKRIFNILLAVAVVILFSNLAYAAEHPGESAHEHTGSPDKAEHKEHPGKTHVAEHPGEKAMLSAGQIIKGIKGHIEEVTQANNGYFPIYDAQEAKYLRLKLVKVHEDRVSYIKKDDAYFACTDFLAEEGKTTYDVDFWMKKDSHGGLKVYQTKIHKKEGKERCSYKDDEIVPVETKKAEPAEHPGQMAPEAHS